MAEGPNLRYNYVQHPPDVHLVLATIKPPYYRTLCTVRCVPYATLPPEAILYSSVLKCGKKQPQIMHTT